MKFFVSNRFYAILWVVLTFLRGLIIVETGTSATYYDFLLLAICILGIIAFFVAVLLKKHKLSTSLFLPVINGIFLFIYTAISVFSAEKGFKIFPITALVFFLLSTVANIVKTIALRRKMNTEEKSEV